MKPLLILLALLPVANTASETLEERIDLFDPASGRFLGSERTFFGPDGRRLRLEITGPGNERTLLFFVLHDKSGREAKAIFFEEEADTPSRERFAYSDNGRRMTTTYYYKPGVADDSVESDLDAEGREVRKRYFRADGSQYGDEDVLWHADGDKLGWDFRYVGREGGASFRYAYQSRDEMGRWTRRTRSRDWVAERTETRTLIAASDTATFITPLRFAAGQVSTKGFETSPSFTRDGKTMVFARYGDDWAKKKAFIAHLGDEGWQAKPIPVAGTIYNVAISPDGASIVYAAGPDGPLYRMHHDNGDWSEPENLTKRYGFAGAYPCLTEAGDLLFYSYDGDAGDGIYLAPRAGAGFGPSVPFYTPESGTTFDGFAVDTEGRLLVTRCFDDTCAAGAKNGIWSIEPGGENSAAGARETKVPGLPYVWGVQPVASLGLFVFTDGEDILAIPLSSAGVGF